MERIRRHPGAFLRLSLRRFYFFWADVPHATRRGEEWTEYVRNLNFQFASITGILGLLLALRRRIPAAPLFAMAFVVVPFVYYFVFVQARFRHPLEPLIAILTVYLFQSAEKSWQVRWFRRSARRASRSVPDLRSRSPPSPTAPPCRGRQRPASPPARHLERVHIRQMDIVPGLRALHPEMRVDEDHHPVAMHDELPRHSSRPLPS